MKRALFRDTLREMKKTLGRFLAIFAIVALGVGFFAGLKATTPDMKHTADDYYDGYNLFDFRLLSTMGFTTEDVASIRGTEGVLGVMPTYQMDVLTSLGGGEKVVKLHGLPSYTDGGNENYINQLRITEGRLPQAANECVVDGNSFYGGLQLGDTVTLRSGTGDPIDDSLENTQFIVVGKTESPYYVSFERGSSTIGSGSVSFYLYIPQSNFKSEYYTELFLTVDGAKELDTFGSAYSDRIDQVQQKLEDVGDTRAAIRRAELVGDAQEELDKKKAEFATQKEEALAKLADAKKEIEDGQKQLDDGKKTLAEKEEELANGKRKLQTAKDTLDVQRQSAFEQIGLAKGQLEEAENDLASQEAALQAFREKLDEAQKTKVQLEENIRTLIALGRLDEAAALQIELDKLLPQLEQQEKSYAENLKLLNAGKAELAEQKKTAEAAEKEALGKLDDAQAQIDANEKTLLAGEEELAKAKTTLAEKEAELVKGKSTYQSEEKKALAELDDAQQKLDEAQKEIDDIPTPEWYVLDRETNPGYVSYSHDAERIDAIAVVFPVFFFLVAALVCLTTMTRMVEEQRTQIGTLKALGYSKWSIAGKYLIYALTASVIGSVIGCAVGFFLFPTVIFNAYLIMYTMPPLVIMFQPWLAVGTSLAAIFITTLAAFGACFGTLMDVPANLMRPKAPKLGKRIFLERIRPLWKHMSFTAKVTARNLFRYKKRFLMTVIGIGGCTALLLTGFGLKDSISDIVFKQYDDVSIYDMSVTLQDETDSEIPKSILENSQVEKALLVHDETGTVMGSSKQMDAHLFIPRDKEELGDFIHMQHRIGGKKVAFTDDGAVLTEKLAKQMGLSVGDTFTLKNADGKKVEVKVSGITENYVYHYVYLSPTYYEELFGEAPTFKGVLVDTKEKLDEAGEEQLANTLIADESIQSVSFSSSLRNNFSDIIKSLNYVVWVLIICAGLLAFIVLYNLTNINVTERIREIATIKVLGFFDGEVSAYVFRESGILTGFGIVFGLVLGIFLHRFVIVKAEVDMVMFGRTIAPLSYILAAVLTVFFAVLVGLVIHRKLKKVSMVESLKSVE